MTNQKGKNHVAPNLLIMNKNEDALVQNPAPGHLRFA